MPFPGPIANALLADSKRYYVPNTQSSSICPAHRRGPYVVDHDGYTFFDFHCDASANNLGAVSDGMINMLHNQVATRNWFAEYHSAPNSYTNALAKFLWSRMRGWCAPCYWPIKISCPRILWSAGAYPALATLFRFQGCIFLS